MKTIAAIIGSALLAAACSDKPPENPSTVQTTATTTQQTEAVAPVTQPTPATADLTIGTSPTYAEGNTSMSTESVANPPSSAPATTTAARNGKSSPYATTGVAPTPAQMDATEPRKSTVDAAAAPAPVPVVKADNTKQNARDRHDALTPVDQGNSKDEVKITASIRKQLVGSRMSFNAKNAKVITTGTKVTLRGPVKTDDERSQIEALARGTTGVTEVDNQLDVKK